MNDQRSVNIIMIEDDEGHARLIEKNIRRAGINNDICHFTDGGRALEYLFEHPEGPAKNGPALILLDLNLPKKDGRGVLSEVKADPVLRHIPVVVLTSSQAEQDIARAYELHANCYVTKPVDLDQFVKIVQSIEQFWFTVVKLPPHP